MSDTEALDAIHGALDNKEWSPHTFEQIATIVTATGRVIRQPYDDPADGHLG